MHTPKNSQLAGRCYETHPPLPLTGDLVIYGGSGAYPVVKGADIYVGLDHGSLVTNESYPWHQENHSFKFLIPDMGVPKSIKEFKSLIVWLAEMLEAGKKVHVGCIGGHGRTGLVFSALVAHMGITMNATEYVRKHYCYKAVESTEQVVWLKKHFNITEAKPTKTINDFSFYSTKKPSKNNNPNTKNPVEDVDRVHHVACSTNIWG